MRNNICLLLVLVIFFSSFCCGCVRRRMTVRSNPPGATVYLDGKEIGRTPFSANFDYYGKREFRLVKQGYETKTVIMPVRSPWYEWIGLDFVSEVILPGKLTDLKFYEFDMQPELVVPTHELVGRAEDLRRTAHSEGAVQVNGGNSSASFLSTPVPQPTPQQPPQLSAPPLAPPLPSNIPNPYIPPRY